MFKKALVALVLFAAVTCGMLFTPSSAEARIFGRWRGGYGYYGPAYYSAPYYGSYYYAAPAYYGGYYHSYYTPSYYAAPYYTNYYYGW